MKRTLLSRTRAPPREAPHSQLAFGNAPVTIEAPTGGGIALETQSSGAQFEDDMDEEDDVELTVDDLGNLG